MLAHQESRSTTAPAHEPARNSSLRQVTATDEQHETELHHPGLMPADPAVAGESGSLTPRDRVTLGIHDGFAMGSSALLNPSAFPQGDISPGTLITIRHASETDPAGNGQRHRDGTNTSYTQEATKGIGGHLFVAESMTADMTAKSSGVQVWSPSWEASSDIDAIQVSIPSNEATSNGLKPHTQVLVTPVRTR